MHTKAQETDEKFSFAQKIVHLDANGGNTLSGCSDKYTSITSSQLKHLDVIDCHSLVSLDISQCHPNCHVTITNCPALQRIYLPEEGLGAVIHMDSGYHLPCIEIKGRVDHFDACWMSGQCSITSTATPWQGVIVNHHLTASSDLLELNEAECWIILSPKAPHLEINAPKVRFIYLSGGSELETLSVVSLSHQTPQIELQAFSRLRIVESHTPIATLRVRHCPSLNELTGCISKLHLSHIGQPESALRIDVPCRHLTLSSSTMQKLEVNQATELSLVHCAGLDQVALAPMTTVQCQGAVPKPLLSVATVVVDEALVKSLVENYRLSPSTSLTELAKLLPSMSPPAPCLKALQLLQRVSKLGAPPDHIWRIRMDLSAMHLSYHTKRRRAPLSTHSIAVSQWKWQLPSDLCREGWLADYQLWKACAGWVPEASLYRDVMLSACTTDPSGLAMQTVLHAMARHSQSSTHEEIGLWSEVMHSMCALEPLSATDWATQARQLSARYGTYKPLDQAYLSACLRHLWLKDLLDVLARIGVHHPEVRASLFDIAQRSSKWREERCAIPLEADHYRAKAIEMALCRMNLD